MALRSPETQPLSRVPINPGRLVAARSFARRGGRVEVGNRRKIGYETVEGRTTATSLGAQDRLQPFGKASAAVVSAALTGSNVVEHGDDTVANIATTCYEIRLTAKSVAASA